MCGHIRGKGRDVSGKDGYTVKLGEICLLSQLIHEIMRFVKFKPNTLIIENTIWSRDMAMKWAYRPYLRSPAPMQWYSNKKSIPLALENCHVSLALGNCYIVHSPSEQSQFTHFFVQICLSLLRGAWDQLSPP